MAKWQLGAETEPLQLQLAAIRSLCTVPTALCCVVHCAHCALWTVCTVCAHCALCTVEKSYNFTTEFLSQLQLQCAHCIYSRKLHCFPRAVVSCVDRVSYWYRTWMPRWRRTASFEIRSSLLVYLDTCFQITTRELLETHLSLCNQCDWTNCPKENLRSHMKIANRL